jgi:hypothetical protein
MAEDDLEEVKILGRDNVVSIPEPGETDVSPAGISYKKIRTTEILAGSLNKCVLVKCVVSWESPATPPRPRSISLATVVSYKFPGPPWQP